MPKIHWLGTGLSAVPGLRRLIATGYDVVVWNRTTDKAQLAVGDLTSNMTKFVLIKNSIIFAVQSLLLLLLTLFELSLYFYSFDRAWLIHIREAVIISRC